MRTTILKTMTVLGIAGTVMIAAAAPAVAQNKKVVIALPGVPPVYSAVIAYVAQKQGFFKKYGADVELRPFDTGTAAARAVVSGDIDMAWSPTPPVISQVSNAGVPLVGVYGMQNTDWILASMDSGKTCKDIAKQPVGVDSVGGARSTALRAILVACPGVKIDDVQQVALGSNVSAAMIAGRLPYGVLHLDDIAVIEAQGKKAYTLLALNDANPNSHYLMLVTRKDKLAQKRASIVGTVAGLIEAARFMNDPKNADVVAEAATVTGHSKEVAKVALKQFLAIKFWATHDDGMPAAKINAVSTLMKKVGAIKEDKQPVKYEDMVDASIWKDANAMVK